MLDFYRVGRVPIHLVSVNSVRDTVENTVSEDRKGYICISNMRTVTLAQKDDAYFQVMNHSLFNTPDGTPLVWCGKLWGLRQVERVAGPDVFVSLLKTSLSQFFLGDTEEVLSRLTERVQQEYGTKVAGMFSPPFAPIEAYDLQEIADRIRLSGAQLVWLSLRAPKQDILASLLLPLLPDGVVCIGVGAAFRVEIGDLKMERGVWQRIGLGGFRMIRNSSVWKEFKWYVSHTFILIKFMGQILFRRLTGVKHNHGIQR